MSKKLACMLAACALLILEGCASFRNNEIAEVEKLPDVSQYSKKPSVYIDLHFFRGEPDKPILEILELKEKLNASIGGVLEESSLFSKYSFDEKDRATSDYVIRLDIYNHGNHGLAAISGFISGLSLTLIPGAATDNYTLEAKLMDGSGSVLNKSSNTDSITTWVGIWFLPVMASTPEKAVFGTLENQVRTVLKELVESGKLKYSLQQHYRRHLPFLAS